MLIWKSNRLWGTGSCQQVRKPPAAALLAPWMWPSNPWHHIHINFAEDKKRHYLILVDAHSRWPEIFYMPRNTTAASTITILRELFAKYRMPVHCVSDNGPQFRSKEFTRFLKMNGVKHVRVARYHVARNGLAERMVQLLKNHMKACKGSKLLIQQRIENFLLTYWLTKHPTTGRTPASLFLGRELWTPLSLLHPNVGEKVLVRDLRKGHLVAMLGGWAKWTEVTHGCTEWWKGVEASRRSREKGQYGQSSIRP